MEGLISPKDTIVALSTPPGEGGISIVRMSGKKSVEILHGIFSSPDEKKNFISHTLSYGHIIDTDGGDVDEVLVGVMSAPGSYTKEDVVEINCHGGTASAKRIIELCCRKGARLANPGEFTRRAFLNGRIDLTQAEAVLDIIKSKTDAARRAALNQLEGKLNEAISSLRKKLADVLVACELSIDFSDQDIVQAEACELRSDISKISESIRELLMSSKKGMILREGAHVVICGKPNVGKSSLMNLLLRRERAIVTSVPGTTRDVIQENIEIGGVLVKMSDTAGIIDTVDRVEKEGIRRSIKTLEDADVVIFMLDSSEELTDRDKGIYDTIKEKPHVVLLNKSDLERKMETSSVGRIFDKDKVIEFSVKKKTGLEQLENKLADLILGPSGQIFPDTMITGIRHKELLSKAQKIIERSLVTAEGSFLPELVASDVSLALDIMGEITGETVKPDILDSIFSNFCIGK